MQENIRLREEKAKKMKQQREDKRELEKQKRQKEIERLLRYIYIIPFSIVAQTNLFDDSKRVL